MENEWKNFPFSKRNNEVLYALLFCEAYNLIVMLQEQKRIFETFDRRSRKDQLLVYERSNIQLLTFFPCARVETKEQRHQKQEFFRNIARTYCNSIFIVFADFSLIFQFRKRVFCDVIQKCVWLGFFP